MIQENLEIPEFLKPYLETVKDYNHRTIKESLDFFEKITKTDINTKIDFSDFKINFWHGLIRGGLQGILYLYENSGLFLFDNNIVPKVAINNALHNNFFPIIKTSYLCYRRLFWFLFFIFNK